MNKIKEIRIIKNIKQNELARKANISQSVLSDIEANKVDPRITTVCKIAEALGVTVQTLIDSKYKPLDILIKYQNELHELSVLADDELKKVISAKSTEELAKANRDYSKVLHEYLKLFECYLIEKNK